MECGMPDEIPSTPDPTAATGPSLKIRDLPAFFASIPRLSPEEAESFDADIERARAEMESIAIHDPWES
jgi:hypothetical protein